MSAGSLSARPGRASAGPLAGVLFLLLGWLCAVPAAAQTFPKFTGFVVDAANIIPATEEAAITARLDDLQRTTGRQLVVATLPSLQGYPIEDYGYRLGRSWGVGLKDLDNGAILIVAPNERRVRIEVGYGLTPVLTDALSSVIINSRIVPAFKAGDMPRGISAGVDGIIEQLRLPDEEAKARVAAAVAQQQKAQQGGSGFPLIFWGIVLAFILFSMMRSRGRGRRYRRSHGPVILWGPGLGGGFGGGGFGGGGSSGGGWMGGGFGGGGGGSFGGGGASGSW
jgi:uncharacterized protein